MVLAGGVLDDDLAVAAIVQQTNCIGTVGMGLAAGVAAKFPYGCPYAGRRLMPYGRFAVPEDRPLPGSIDVRPPHRLNAGPIVINMFAQWELGPALKYNRVPAPPGTTDSCQQREQWFSECIKAIDALGDLSPSIAFPHEIGCGLAGGRWAHYEDMIVRWAREHPGIEVTICWWTSAHTGGSAGRKGRGKLGK